MNAPFQIKMSNNSGRLPQFDLNVERGMFLALSDLIKIETNLIWDSVGAFFSLTGGYQIHKYAAGGGMVLDPDGQEIFLTNQHIDALFNVAMMRAKQLSRHRYR